MPFALLKDRALISVSGPDAEHFLQNILTTDLDTLDPGETKPGALLAPQGKILFDFLISRAGENGFRLECRADIADDFVRRLMRDWKVNGLAVAIAKDGEIVLSRGYGLRDVEQDVHGGAGRQRVGVDDAVRLLAAVQEVDRRFVEPRWLAAEAARA